MSDPTYIHNWKEDDVSPGNKNDKDAHKNKYKDKVIITEHMLNFQKSRDTR